MKFGVIGTNFVSTAFMDGAAQAEECDVVAVCGSSLNKAEQFSAQYGIQHCFDSYQKMYDAHLIDAVYIAVPNGLHYEMAKHYLCRGIPTFCEKPLASNYKQAKDLVECAKKSGTYLQEGLIPLYNPNFQTLKANLNLVGTIHQVNLNFSKYSTRYDAFLRGENPTTFRRELSNGATMDLGVYLVANCIGLFGPPEKILSASSLLETGADVAGCSILQYAGFHATLSYSKASDTRNICDICGELGQLTIDQPSQPHKIQFIDRKTGKTKDLSVIPKENFYYEISEMITQIKNGNIESQLVPFSTILDVHKTLAEIRKQSNIVFPADL